MITAPSQFLTANVELQKKPIFLVTISNYSRVFTNYATGIAGQYDWIDSFDDVTLTVSEFDGGSDLGGFNFTVQDFQGLITADFPSIVFEGQAVTLKTGFVGMNQSDFLLLFTGVIDTVPSANGNLSYTFNCIDTSQIHTKVIYTAGDDGFATSKEHPRTLNGHPLDILTAALINEIGLDSSAINLTKINSYRDGLFIAQQFSFTIESPPQAKDFLEKQILKPLGGYLWTNNEGKIDVNFFYKDVRDSVLSLNDDNMVGVPLAGQTDLLNQVSYRFDQQAGSSGDFMTEAVQNYEASIDLYNQYGQQIVESAGMRAGLQGVFLAVMVSNVFFQRFGLKNLTFPEVIVHWSACCVDPGDIIDMSSEFVPDRMRGVMGISAMLFEVFDRTWDLNNGLVKLRLVDASYLSRIGTAKVAPDGTPAWTSASGAQKATYMFQCNDSDKYSDGANAVKLP